MVKIKVPDKGDIVWLSSNPQAGHEQSGRRPALVISPQEYNGKTDLAIFCKLPKDELVDTLNKINALLNL